MHQKEKREMPHPKTQAQSLDKQELQYDSICQQRYTVLSLQALASPLKQPTIACPGHRILFALEALVGPSCVLSTQRTHTPA